MQNTTRPAIPALESINPDVLFLVSGGCKKSCPPQAPAAAAAPVMQVLQMPQMPAAQTPQLPPQQIAQGGGDSVTTSVSINGQAAA